MRFVIASVNYADFLQVTLPAWKDIVPRGLMVATSPDDPETIDVARSHGVACCVTDAWTTKCTDHVGGDPKFNLGHGLNVALGLCAHGNQPPREGELVGHASADCYPFGFWLDESALSLGVLYGFWRHLCMTQKDLDNHIAGKTKRSAYTKLKNSGGRPIGYFQMFRYQEGRRFPSYPTAGKFDTDMVGMFTRFEMRDELYLLHLGLHDNHQNWAGRVMPQWGHA